MERLDHALKVFSAKNGKVLKNDNHSDISVHASEPDVDGTFSDKDDYH